MRRIFAGVTVLLLALVAVAAAAFLILDVAGAAGDFKVLVPITVWLYDHPKVMAALGLVGMASGIAAWRTPPLQGVKWTIGSPVRAEFVDLDGGRFLRAQADVLFANSTEQECRCWLKVVELQHRRWWGGVG